MLLKNKSDQGLHSCYSIYALERYNRKIIGRGTAVFAVGVEWSSCFHIFCLDYPQSTYRFLSFPFSISFFLDVGLLLGKIFQRAVKLNNKSTSHSGDLALTLVNLAGYGKILYF